MIVSQIADNVVSMIVSETQFELPGVMSRYAAMQRYSPLLSVGLFATISRSQQFEIK